MKLATAKLLWSTYNNLFFLGQMTEPRFFRTRSKWADGFFEGNENGFMAIYLHSNPEQNAREVLIHEMCHQWQYEILETELSHNRFFWALFEQAKEKLL